MLNIVSQLFVFFGIPVFFAIAHMAVGPLALVHLGLKRLDRFRPPENGRFGFWQDDSFLRMFLCLLVVVPHCIFVLTAFLSFAIRRPYNLTREYYYIYGVSEACVVVAANFFVPKLLHLEFGKAKRPAVIVDKRKEQRVDKRQRGKLRKLKPTSITMPKKVGNHRKWPPLPYCRKPSRPTTKTLVLAQAKCIIEELDNRAKLRRHHEQKERTSHHFVP